MLNLLDFFLVVSASITASINRVWVISAPIIISIITTVVVVYISVVISDEIIISVILMPRLDGYQTCAIIKRNERFAATPVIMLSSKDGVFDKARGRMVGSEEYLTKPFTKDQLLQAVTQFGIKGE